MGVYTLTPTSAPNVAVWTNETDALSEDGGAGLWAVNLTGADNTYLELTDFSPSGTPGGTEVISGIEIETRIGAYSNTGTPAAACLAPDVNWMIMGLSKNGSTLDGTVFTETLDGMVGAIVRGAPGNLLGLTWTWAELLASSLLFRRGIEVADYCNSSTSSVEYGRLKVYTYIPNIPIISSAEGGCDGDVDIAWSN